MERNQCMHQNWGRNLFVFGTLGPEYFLDPCYLKCGLWPRNIQHPGNLIEMQKLKPHAQPTESESTFNSLQVMYVHVDIEEALPYSRYNSSFINLVIHSLNSFWSPFYEPDINLDKRRGRWLQI